MFAALHARLEGEGHVRLGKLADTEGAKTYGFLVLLLGIPALVPGLATVIAPLVGLAGLALGLQMALGRSRPWIPRRFRAMRVHRERTKGFLHRFEQLLQRFGGRGLHGKRPIPRGILGLLVAWTALVLASPLAIVPFSNAAPSVALCLMGTSLVEERPALGWAGAALSMAFSAAVAVFCVLYWQLLVGPLKAMLGFP